VKPMMKYTAIYKHKEKYPVATMCAFFEVSKSGYYDFIKRMDAPDRDEALAAHIAECQAACRKTYGYRRVHIWLERVKHIRRNPKTVLRIMRKYGLLSEIRRRRKYKHMGKQLHIYANHLNRNFHADRPNQKWVTDISYIHTAQGVLYLSAIRDLFDSSIVAYRTGTEQTVNLVLDTIRIAKKETVATEVHLHSDQGFQYTSHGYFNLTKEYGIIPSMSRRGNCLDNAMAENFFSILKSECINRQKIKSFDEAKSLIDNYIWFYNHERVQLKTKLTPLEIRRQFV
jgi:transposase InsO family protein